MGAALARRDDAGVNISIRCHPCAPVETSELEGWLENETDRIRGLVAPDGGGVRLMRLTQELPSGLESVGWLLEIDTGHEDDPLGSGELDTVLRDMRLLGLQPTILEAAAAA
jgi:hypothetical protein